MDKKPKQKYLRIPEWQLPFEYRGRNDVGLLQVYVTGTPKQQKVKTELIAAYAKKVKDVFNLEDQDL